MKQCLETTQGSKTSQRTLLVRVCVVWSCTVCISQGSNTDTNTKLGGCLPLLTAFSTTLMWSKHKFMMVLQMSSSFTIHSWKQTMDDSRTLLTFCPMNTLDISDTLNIHKVSWNYIHQYESNRTSWSLSNISSMFFLFLSKLLEDSVTV